jgi:hypothetical protein
MPGIIRGLRLTRGECRVKSGMSLRTTSTSGRQFAFNRAGPMKGRRGKKEVSIRK